MAIDIMSYKLGQKSGGGGGEPSEYIKSASVEGNTLALVKKDDSTVTFTPQGGGSVDVVTVFNEDGELTQEGWNALHANKSQAIYGFNDEEVYWSDYIFFPYYCAEGDDIAIYFFCMEPDANNVHWFYLDSTEPGAVAADYGTVAIGGGSSGEPVPAPSAAVANFAVTANAAGDALQYAEIVPVGTKSTTASTTDKSVILGSSSQVDSGKATGSTAASGNYNVVVGPYARAGRFTYQPTNYNTVVGANATTYGQNAAAFGYYANAFSYSVAIGANAFAGNTSNQGSNNVVVGAEARAEQHDSTVIGCGAKANDIKGVAIGCGAESYNCNGGYYSNDFGSTAIGTGAYNCIPNSVSFDKKGSTDGASILVHDASKIFFTNHTWSSGDESRYTTVEDFRENGGQSLQDVLDSFEDTIDAALDPTPEEITYENLIKKVALKGLVPGKRYRIINFLTKAKGLETNDYQFDLIVTAKSTTEIDENAEAVPFLHSCVPSGDITFLEMPSVDNQIPGLFYIAIDGSHPADQGYGEEWSDELHNEDMFIFGNFGEHPTSGKNVPIIYKTNVDDYLEEGPDMGEPAYWEGKFELNDETYDMWTKYEPGEDGEGDDVPTWKILTRVIIEGELKKTPFALDTKNNLRRWKVRYSLENNSADFDWAVESTPANQYAISASGTGQFNAGEELPRFSRGDFGPDDTGYAPDPGYLYCWGATSMNWQDSAIFSKSPVIRKGDKVFNASIWDYEYLDDVHNEYNPEGETNIESILVYVEVWDYDINDYIQLPKILYRVPSLDDKNTRTGMFEYFLAWAENPEETLWYKCFYTGKKTHRRMLKVGSEIFDASTSSKMYSISEIFLKDTGRGVIYEMEDEFGNKAGFDFKNINAIPGTIEGISTCNVIEPTIIDKKRVLNHVEFDSEAVNNCHVESGAMFLEIEKQDARNIEVHSGVMGTADSIKTIDLSETTGGKIVVKSATESEVEVAA